MLPSLVASVFFMLIAVLVGVTPSLKASETANDATSTYVAQSAVSKAVKDYYAETYTFPASLGALAYSPGYAHLRQYMTRTGETVAGTTVIGPIDSSKPIVNVAVSNPFSDSNNPSFVNFKRVVTYTSPTSRAAPIDFLAPATNKCPGAQSLGFVDSTTWCGDSTLAIWSVTSDRAQAGSQETIAKKYMQMTVDKFVTRYNAVKVTNPGTASIWFPAQATKKELRLLVTPSSGSAVGATALQCSGLFSWTTTPASTQGIPFNCGDLYNTFGNPVSYRKTANTSIELSSDSKFKDATGTGYRPITAP